MSPSGQGGDRWRGQAESFGSAAASYERGRPSYPAAALDWLIPTGAVDVLDLGAGTGKLTRELVTRELTVTAVEPSDGMRAELTNALPDIPAVAGSAERIPLPDDSFDCVLVAQAWHWVDPARARVEVARVLRPGGRLGLIWNTRDERSPWVAELGRLMRNSFGHAAEPYTAEFGHLFSAAERYQFAWHFTMTPEMLIDMVTSRSYVITATADDRDALLASVRQLLEAHPALAGQETFQMPYLSDCFRAHLLAVPYH